jgi:hypothetical protein
MPREPEMADRARARVRRVGPNRDSPQVIVAVSDGAEPPVGFSISQPAWLAINSGRQRWAKRPPFVCIHSRSNAADRICILEGEDPNGHKLEVLCVCLRDHRMIPMVWATGWLRLVWRTGGMYSVLPALTHSGLRLAIAIRVIVGARPGRTAAS